MKLHLTKQEAAFLICQLIAVRDATLAASTALRHAGRGGRVDVTAVRDLCRQISKANGQAIVLLGQIERSTNDGTDLTAHL